MVRAGLTVPAQASQRTVPFAPFQGLTLWPLFWGGRETGVALLGAGGDSTPRSGRSRASGARSWGGLGGEEGRGEDGAGTWRKGCWKLCSLLPPQPWATKLSAHLQRRERRSHTVVQRGPADQLAPPNAKRPYWGDWAQTGAPSQRGQSRCKESSSGGVDRRWGLESLSLRCHEPLAEVQLFLKF